MDSKEETVRRLREERMAREKSRIEKLRELNLKKYNKNVTQSTPAIKPAVSSASIPRPSKASALTKATKSTEMGINNFHVNSTNKRPITVPLNRKSMVSKDMKLKKVDNVKGQNSKPTITDNIKGQNSKSTVANVKVQNKADSEKGDAKDKNDKANQVIHDNVKAKEIKGNIKVVSAATDGNIKLKQDSGLQAMKSNVSTKPVSKNFVLANKLIQCKPSKTQVIKQKPVENVRKQMLPHSSNVVMQVKRQSVFERLYQPKLAPNKEIHPYQPISVPTAGAHKEINEVKKIQTDAKYFTKVVMNSGLILNKRRTCFETQKPQMPVRRSISAVHFKRIKKSEVNNCIHKWGSIDDKLNKVSLKDINEDYSVQEDKITSAVKSEKKKVQFQTPVPFNFNTPKTEELQARLHNWLQKRGKSIDSYHHLQCFGIHHLSSNIKPLSFEETLTFDDENKENVPLKSDSDNESYNENMNEHEEIDNIADDKSKWRHASLVSDSVDFSETQQSMLTLPETPYPQADKLLLGALYDLTELLHEGFDWEQCAQWLRAIRTRFPSAPDSAAYWECRAALEERRGDLSNSIHCWEEAIAKGTERSVVEANLEQLLDKFMQLQISPNSGRRAPPDAKAKMIDARNIFKSTIIRFAVHKAKQRQSTGPEPPKYTCTPVRRSSRLSRARTPLQVCASVKQASLLAAPVEFVPNHTLNKTP